MSIMKRRDFLKATGACLGAAALATAGGGCSGGSGGGQVKTGWQGFQYAMCNECMQGETWEKQCHTIAGAGYSGIEVAPFSLVEKGVDDISAAQRKTMADTLAKTGLSCAGLHWLLAPPPEGLHFTTPDAAIRQKAVDYLHKLIDFTGDLGGRAMIFGSPQQRSTVNVPVAEALKHMADGLAQVADHAQDRQVTILIEPIGKPHTDVVNTMADAAAMVKQVDHPYIQTMFDFHNTTDETEPFHALVDRHFDTIYHVHVQAMDGGHMTEDGPEVKDFVKTFQTLKDLGYWHWISLEVFKLEPGGETIAQSSMKALKAIEAQLA